MEIAIRLAGPADADAARQLVYAAYQHYVQRIGRRPRPMVDDYDAIVARGQLWLAHIGDQLVGCVALIDEDDHLLIDNLAVAGEMQGHGIGGRLLAFAEERARSRGHAELRLYTHVTMVENIAYYPRRGYVETHRAGDPPFRRVFFAKRLI